MPISSIAGVTNKSEVRVVRLRKLQPANSVDPGSNLAAIVSIMDLAEQWISFIRF